MTGGGARGEEETEGKSPGGVSGLGGKGLKPLSSSPHGEQRGDKVKLSNIRPNAYTETVIYTHNTHTHTSLSAPVPPAPHACQLELYL